MSDAKPVVHSACVARSSGLWVQMETIKTAPTTDPGRSRRGLTANQSAKKEGAVQQDSHTHRQQLDPEDPRHGTYAGVKAHGKAGTANCEPCAHASYLFHKRMKIRLEKGIRNRIPLGQEAHAAIGELGATQISAESGINRNMLYRLAAEGPERIVLRSTRDRIIACLPGAYTMTGIQRRIRSLHALGYSGHVIAAYTDSDRDSILRLARREVDFVRREYALRIIATYDELHMVRPPATRGTARVAQHARSNGWHPPLAWDDIDTDPEPISCDDATEAIDEVKVQRVLDRRPQRDLNRAERDAVLDRWDGTQAELNRLTGWNVDRLLKERKAA